MIFKKGMEIAVNNLVVIILGIVLLGLGIFLVTKMVSKGTDLSAQVDERLIEQLRRTQFNDGKLVAVLNPHEKVARGKDARFLLGFVNKDTTNQEFTIKAKYNIKSPVHNSLSAQQKSTMDDYLLFIDTPVPLSPNEDFFTTLLFTSDKDLPVGEYLFDIYVCYDGNHYSSEQPCNNPLKLYANDKQRLFIDLY